MTKHKLRKAFSERFFEKVDQGTGTGCWEWTAAKKEKGYGVLGRGRRGEGIVKAHRASWEIHNGPIPEGMNVLHKCDNPGCVNPNHLFLGTFADNSQDMVSKGRDFRPDNRGERATWAKLTNEEVEDILTRRMPGRQFAKLYGVSKSAVFNIWRGKSWRSISEGMAG